MNALLSVRAFAIRAAGVRFLLLAMLMAAFGVARGADTFLEPERAFVLSARAIDARQVEVRFDIAPGYYLYGDKFDFAAEGVTLGPAVLPKGKIKFDETFQKDVESHRDTIRIVLPVEKAAGEFKLAVTSQGCADAGLCYPPQEQFLAVSLTGFDGDGTVRLLAAAEPSGDL